MAEQMIRDDGKPDKNGHKSIVADKIDKQVVSEKGKKSERGKGKTSVTKRSQTRGSDSPIPLRGDIDKQILSEREVPGLSTSNVDFAQILTKLNAIQNNQNTQSEEMKSLASRMTNFENQYQYDNDGEYDDPTQEMDQDDYQNNEFDDHDQDEVPSGSSHKRKANDNYTGRFASMSKRTKTRETLGDKIDETLAENVNDLFRNGMNEDQFVELTKDETNPRPENCEGLATVKTNQLIWDIISPHAQSVDRKMQIIQKAIVKASTVLVNTVNKMADTDENKESIDDCNDSIAILGHANRKINITRRELMKPEMCSEYVHLCAQSVEYTSYLFGDDVQKRAKEIEDCSKISHKIQSGNSGYGGYGNGKYYSRRGGSRSFGRGGRGGRRSRGGRGGRGYYRGGSFRGASNQTTIDYPKNLPKRGGFQNKDRT